LQARHSFSFGEHYDPANVRFGLLEASNDDVVAAGAGFDAHLHRDMEIVTWVLSGSLVHRDTKGHSGLIYPGLAQRMTAGTGIVHSETNDSWRVTGGESHARPVRFVQMWVTPDAQSYAPSYQQAEVDDARLREGLVPVASGAPEHRTDAAVRIGQRYATFSVARMSAGQAVQLPAAVSVHLFVAVGELTLEGFGPLAEGDAARLSDASGERVTATASCEILVWELGAPRGS
jgi:redox-sensitive bicupin YhaK (pirin superfamily)